ncbi:MAG: histidine kinase [Ferruginibacter sp.]
MIRIFFFLLLLNLNAVAQTQRIDSIRRAILLLKGEPLVHAYNALGWQYYYNWIHADSALKYARLAQQHAGLLGYNKGKAESFLIEAGVEGRLLGRQQEMEKYTLSAISLLKEKPDDNRLLSTAYYSLALSFAIRGDYDSALAASLICRQLATTIHDKRYLGWSLQGVGFVYSKKGEFWKAFPFLAESARIGKETNDSMLTSISLAFIARSFTLAGDPRQGINYYHQALQYYHPFVFIWSHYLDMASAYTQINKPDSALYYRKKFSANILASTTDEKVRNKFFATQWHYTLDMQLSNKEYDSIIGTIVPALPSLKKNRDVIPLMICLHSLASAYEGKHNYNSSLYYARDLYKRASITSNQEFLKSSSLLLSGLFEKLHLIDSSYAYFRQYNVVKDSMETSQYAGRTALYLAASEAENNIRLLKKDKEIKEKQLYVNKKELEKQSHVKNLLAISLIVFALFAILILRNIILKRKNEKLKSLEEHSTLTRKALELEMQALRAQMNPHFIFNCLSAIDNLIQTNQADKATSYLARFAKLIRAVLDSSKNNLVLFQKDFETIRLYLEMEQFRCNNKFQYMLDADICLMQGDFKVPPLIVQPFIENAIHHGLLNKASNERQLKVCARLCEEHITYTITDNGIGRTMAGILKERNRPEHLSYGISISRERIQLHNKNGLTNNLVFTDLEYEGKATGTEAMVRINCVE